MKPIRDAAAATEMTDAELLAAWSAVEDGDNLTPLQQAVIDEIERRELDI
jgi:hypothetical protein